MSALKLVTYNLRFGIEEDPQPWSRRRGPMIELLRGLAPGVLGTQEGLDHQLADVLAGLGEHYAMVAEHRGDGEREESSAILYDTGLLELTEVRHRWLSPTPEVPGSRGWGAYFPRMYSVARFRRIADGGALVVIATHLDHEVEQARLESARILAAEVTALGSEVPLVLMGDFNVDVGSAPYRVLLEAGLRDAVEVASRRGPVTGTFNAYGPPDPEGERIDWVLVNDLVQVGSARVVDAAPGGPYPSDHLPVEVVIETA